MELRPAIFISAASRELKSARQLVANTLGFLGYEPVWQDIFGTEQGDLRGMLRARIDECEGVVQLVGRRYGAEPPVPDEQFGRVSYTQYEALYARHKGKKVWYLVMDESFPVDSAEPEPAELRALQAAYLHRLQSDSRLYHPLASAEALEASVLKLRNDLSRLRSRFRQWSIAVLVLLLVLVAAVVWIKKDERKANQQLHVVTDELAQLLLKENSPPPAAAAVPPESAAGAPYSPPAYGASPQKGGGYAHPKLALSVFGLGQDATNWQALGPETSLRSGEHFFIRAETFTPGFLYLFLVDASGKLQWLFPANPTLAYSSGADPLPARVAVTLPPGNDQAYALDDTVGEERVYAVYSASRWEKLEAALKSAGDKPTAATQAEITALLTADAAIEARARGIARVENTAVAKEVRQAASPAGEPLLVDLPARSAEATGHWLLQVRRFRHLARAAAR